MSEHSVFVNQILHIIYKNHITSKKKKKKKKLLEIKSHFVSFFFSIICYKLIETDILQDRREAPVGTDGDLQVTNKKTHYQQFSI